MPVTARFITAERRDLFDMTQRLVRAVAAGFLADPRHPLTINVVGGLSAGKKIVADAVRLAMLDALDSAAGRAEYDEYWRGRRAGRPLEVDFINLGWQRGYGDPALNEIGDRRKLRRFKAHRVDGGVTILQNGSRRVSRDITICIEDTDAHTVAYETPRHRKYPGVPQQFAAVCAQSRHSLHWARYVEIGIENPALLTGEFRAALASLAVPPAMMDGTGLAARFRRAMRGDAPADPAAALPVFGRDITRQQVVAADNGNAAEMMKKLAAR